MCAMLQKPGGLAFTAGNASSAPSSLDIHVLRPSGESIPLNIQSNITVKTLQEMISQQTELDMDEQDLVLNDERLADVTAQPFLSAQEGETPEITLIYRPALEKFLADEGFADVNAVDKRRGSALHVAANRRRPRMCMAILAMDEFTQISSLDGGGGTALHSAARSNLPDVCKAILEHSVSGTLLKGVDLLEITSVEGRTALHLATKSGSIDCCNVLVEAKSDLNATDHSGATPLICAAKYAGAETCLALLRNASVDVAHVDNFRHTAADYAATFPEVLEALSDRAEPRS